LSFISRPIQQIGKQKISSKMKVTHPPVLIFDSRRGGVVARQKGHVQTPTGGAA
jgi:hypothetical protein